MCGPGTSGLRARSGTAGIDPSDISIWPPVHNIDPTMRSVTKHEKKLIGKVHLHDGVAYRHRAHPRWRFSYYSGSPSPIHLFEDEFAGALRIYDIVDPSALEKMRRFYGALTMAFKPALVAAQPFFEPFHCRIDANLSIGAGPGGLHIEA
jgi:hypothetical protein